MGKHVLLKRLERLAARRSVSSYSVYEQHRLEDMTDEKLAREIALMEDMLRTLYDAGALGDVLKDERLELEALELLRAAAG